MTMTRTIGGNRLGSGKKMTVDMKTYERSTHDLSYIWRSTQAPGTLVPFMSELALPGDTFDIDLNCDIMTHPTVGPLFGSYKVQLDVFLCPIRLYQGQLHNNKLGIGLNMASIKLPQLKITTNQPPSISPPINPDNQQINPSSIFSYLNIRGVGISTGPTVPAIRQFNAIPYLSYWDIYKNYYANKQEEIGAVIHAEETASPETIEEVNITNVPGTPTDLPEVPAGAPFEADSTVRVQFKYLITAPNTNALYIRTEHGDKIVAQMFDSIVDNGIDSILCTIPKVIGIYTGWRYKEPSDLFDGTPQVYTFPLDNLDQMRENILKDVDNTGAFIIDETSLEPYNLPFKWTGTAGQPTATYSKMNALEGLAVKTYQSDLFNNWLQTEWIDGTNGISEVTAIDTSGGSFTIDTLNLSKKVYDMLNRIAISGGTYDDWQETVYSHESYRRAETPMYMGGLIKELVFQEVISNSEATNANGTQPLGTLAGRGVMGKKHKGGKVTVKVDEPSYIMGIISLTPRIDYSQGNKWDTGLKTMDDFHKPALDEIGFQDLIQDQMAWWSTVLTAPNTPMLLSAGKQPAWINYMTNVNQVRGNFAIEGNEMFMTLNRKYTFDPLTGNLIKDLTTYIDPAKFNDIFAETSRDAQNFWTQIGVGITARRKMSARIIPNL